MRPHALVFRHYLALRSGRVPMNQAQNKAARGIESVISTIGAPSKCCYLNEIRSAVDKRTGSLNDVR